MTSNSDIGHLLEVFEANKYNETYINSKTSLLNALNFTNELYTHHIFAAKFINYINISENIKKLIPSSSIEILRQINGEEKINTVRISDA